MRLISLLTLIFALTIVSGCYMTEDAADVNQERIRTIYCTEFNATRDYTKSVVSFKFGHTPLRLSNSTYFRDKRLYEKKDPIWGLHYSRDLDGIRNGVYEWMDENGAVYQNKVKAFAFDLIDPPEQLKKYTYYRLDWEGDDIPYTQGEFQLTIESLTDGTICSFNSGTRPEIEADQLHSLPEGRAILKISRNYSEPIDEGTRAGGESTVSFIREYEITIIE